MITIYCSTFLGDNDLAGCGMILESVDDHARSTIRRMGFALGVSCDKLSSILSLKLALSSVKKAHRDKEVVVFVDNDYVIDVLEQKVYDYPKESGELQKWFTFYTNLRISHDVPCDLMYAAREIAKICASEQKHHDERS